MNLRDSTLVWRTLLPHRANPLVHSNSQATLKAFVVLDGEQGIQAG
jgi:hypothetical protein